jgi:hypothetical protein
MWLLFMLIAGALAAPVQDGDIVFQTSHSAQSEAIHLATGSAFSHVGIVTVQDGESLVLEAVGPVKTTPLKAWIARGVGGRYRLMRPKTPLSTAQLSGMDRIGRQHLGKDYDLRFDWSDDKMYCSELVWKIYSKGAGLELAAPRPMGSYRLGHPRVMALIAARWGDTVRLSEKMIAPSDLAQSPLLEIVEDTMPR